MKKRTTLKTSGDVSPGKVQTSEVRKRQKKKKKNQTANICKANK